ncbi:hypothetical protein G5C51_31410 [Streptomyces sp. A7024]|uniref:Secreted protein n=1 Tax=Streptomyces coryli TaxID=1128680 RepID=A0A6G4U876_9ACTN|nr:DUF5719 family protein [Streptomyces coryli]NGN68394.1 hypothetical protein [Streptomyces coryli]
MTRNTLALAAVCAALAAITGVAAVTVPDGDAGADTAPAAAKRLPVERATLVCPAPAGSDVGESTYTSFTPSGDGKKGSAALKPAARDDADGKAGDDAKRGKAVAELKQPGKPVVAQTGAEQPPALVGQAGGGFAPGWTVQQTSEIDAGDGRGLSGARCTAPDTEFWFPGASTDKDRHDYVTLANPDAEPAVVDIELHGKSGALRNRTGEGITIPAHSSTEVLLSTLTDEPQTNLAVKVTARSGRIGAAVRAADTKLGGDWLQASAAPAPSVVIPGIPEDATSVRLVAYAPGADDADVKVRLAGPASSIAPAGHETLHVKAGMTAAVDLGDVTKGEPGSLVLTPTADGGTPIVAAVRVTRGKGREQELGFIPATSAISERGTAAGSQAKGSTLALTAPGKKAAKVKVVSSAGSGGGEPAEKTYTVKPGTTMSVTPPAPSGLKGAFAVTVEKLSGGAVYASRTLTSKTAGAKSFTVQGLPDDGSTVAVPEAESDLSVLGRD